MTLWVAFILGGIVVSGLGLLFLYITDKRISIIDMKEKEINFTEAIIKVNKHINDDTVIIYWPEVSYQLDIIKDNMVTKNQFIIAREVLERLSIGKGDLK